jgi:hypothetical protein
VKTIHSIEYAEARRIIGTIAEEALRREQAAAGAMAASGLSPEADIWLAALGGLTVTGGDLDRA